MQLLKPCVNLSKQIRLCSRQVRLSFNGKKQFGKRPFSIFLPQEFGTTCHSLLVTATTQSLTAFRRNLMTRRFQSAFTAPWRPSHKCALILIRTGAIYKSSTYLLTYSVLNSLPLEMHTISSHISHCSLQRSL